MDVITSDNHDFDWLMSDNGIDLVEMEKIDQINELHQVVCRNQEWKGSIKADEIQTSDQLQQEQEKISATEQETKYDNLFKENQHFNCTIQMVMVENDELKRHNIILAKGIAERENKIKSLQRELDDAGKEPESQWMKSLLESKQELKDRIRVTEIENEDLADECMVLGNIVKEKTDEVEELQKRVKALEDEKKQFVDAKEEGYSALVQELFEQIEMLSEKVKQQAVENERLSKKVFTVKNELAVDGELAELVEFLEMERKFTLEEIEERKAENESNKDKSLRKNADDKMREENTKLKEQVTAWSKGFALLMKKEKKMFSRMNLRKNRSLKVASLAKEEMRKRKSSEKRCKKIKKRLQPIPKQKGKDKNVISGDEKQDSANKMEDLEKRNEELAELVEFLEMERKFTLEEIEEHETDRKQRLRKHVDDQEKEILRRSEMERIYEQMKAKYECIKDKFDCEFQKNMELEQKIMKLEERIENSNKSSLNCFQKLLRRRTR